jgi:hypothetical protein
MNMKEVFDSVSDSPRLRRFSTSYVLIYFILTLVFNLVFKLVPVLNTFAGGYPKSFVVFLFDAALLYGLIRGIVTKNYKIGDTLGSFADVSAYPLYLTYAGINLALEILAGVISGAVKNIAALSIAVTVVFFILELLVNFFIVRLFFDRILLKSRTMNFKGVFESCKNVLANKASRVVSIEVMNIVVNFISLTVLTFVSVYLPKNNDTVSFVLTCLSTVKLGMLIYTWPIYYLYYKDTFEL